MNIFYNGMRVILNSSLVDTEEDWSKVRSPSRAARRRKQGHQQCIQFISKPKIDVYVTGQTMIMHPATWSKMQSLMSDEDKVKVKVRA